MFIDGGIKRGSDVFKALAIGASAVGIGRAALFGMAGYGQEGVEKTLEILQDELYTTMQVLPLPWLLVQMSGRNSVPRKGTIRILASVF